MTNPTTTPELSTDAEVVEFLKEHPFFKGMPQGLLQEVAACASTESLAQQHKVFRQDGNANRFYLVLEGEVAVEIPAIDGEPAVIQKLGPGSVLGWSWLIPPYRWSFDARTLRSTRLLVLDGEQLRDKCEADPQLGYALIKRSAALMGERLQAARRRVMDLYVGAPY